VLLRRLIRRRKYDLIGNRMDTFISQLVDLCRAHPWTTKWVFVRSHALGHTIGERLARSGTAWGNVRFTTPGALAMEIAGPHLAARGLDVLDETTAPALVLRLLLELPHETPNYFRPLADQPGIAVALWNTVSELRLAGIDADQLNASAFAGATKHGELRALLQSYEKYLDTASAADSAGIFDDAAAHAAEGPTVATDVVLELPGTCRSTLQRSFLDCLPGARPPARILDIPRLEIPTWPQRRPVERVRPTCEPLSDSQRLRYLLAPDQAPAAAGDGTLTMFRAAGKEAEVEEVFRRIQAGRIALDEVEIACAQPDAYAPLLWDKAQRHGWRLTLEMGIPGTLTRPVRALLAFCDWIETGFSAVRMIRLLESGDLAPELGEDFGTGSAARLLRRAGATLGRDTYRMALAGLAASDRQSAEDAEAEPEDRAYYAMRAARCERLAEWFRELFSRIPASSESEIGRLLDASAAFLTQAAVKSEEDAAAQAGATNAIAQLEPLRDFPRPVAFALTLLRDCLSRIRVCADRSRPGALHATSLQQAGYSGRAHTFVVGLEEGGVFLRGCEDPVLLDDERMALAAPPLPSSRDRVAEAVYAALARLTSLEGNVCLSYSCRDLREGRETFPSWILFQALALLDSTAELKLRTLEERLGEPVSVVPRTPADALTDSDWWMASLRGIGPTAIPYVLGAFPALGRGVAAERRRELPELTEFDGLAVSAGPVVDLGAAGRVVSASTLERIAACPFRYFVEAALGVEALEEEEPEFDRWLDPKTRGELIHAVLAEFLRQFRAEQRRPTAGDRDLLHALANKRIEHLREQMPPLSESVFQHEVRQLGRDLDLFLKREIAAQGRTPVALEVTFGMEAGETTEPLASAEPIPFDLGDGRQLLLRGRIDRIDRLEDGSYEVIDYKTGSFYRPQYAGIFAGGTLLQHALYCHAARRLLAPVEPRPRMAGSTYYFVTERGGARQKTFEPDLDAGAVLRDLADAVNGGAFPQAHEDRSCGICGYGRACGDGAVERAKRKFENEAEWRLAAYRRLAAHA